LICCQHFFNTALFVRQCFSADDGVERAALKDHNLHEQSKKIQKLEDECKALKKGLSDLRKPT
jgi:hypothetical protein